MPETDGLDLRKAQRHRLVQARQSLKRLFIGAVSSPPKTTEKKTKARVT